MNKARNPRGSAMVRCASVVLTIMLVATLAAISPAAAQAQPQQPTQPPAKVASTASVTLLTGDVVRMTTYTDGRRQAIVLGPDGGPGRDAMSYSSGKAFYVVPTEVLPYLKTDRLDKRLFDVAGLIEQGYGDATSPSLPLIFTYADGAALTAQNWLSSTATTPPRALSSVDAVAVQTDKRRIRSVWEAVDAGGSRLANGVHKILLDSKVKVALEESVPMVGAPQAWQQGLDGRGITIGVVDTGVDATHPDLAGKVIAQENFTDEPTAEDGHGHGTHVAATAAGSGNGSAGRRKGVAPGASIVAAKTVTSNDEGLVSWQIAGMEWAAQRADVINVSLGLEPTDGTDLWSQALNELSATTGALFVVAAGNNGRPQSVTNPGSADAALTVGNVTKSDELAGSSSQGPRLGDYAVKPEITAPGTDIVAARAKGTELGPIIDEIYTSATGTSMASPHVTGAAAILAQRHPDWNGEALKSTLVGSARPNPGLGVFEQGGGRLDIPTALEHNVMATPTTLTFGFLKWPNQNQPPITRATTYRNTGTTPATLDITASATVEPDHSPAPDGLVTLSARELTVPAGGTAELRVTVDPQLVPGADIGGVVLAAERGTGRTVRTPLSLGVEPESHDLTVRAIGRDGKPSLAVIQIWQRDWTDSSLTFVMEDSEVLRLPKAEYMAMGFVFAADGQVITDLTVGGDPEVVLDRDQTVTLDARRGREVSVQVPDRDAQVRSVLLAWQRRYSPTNEVNSPYVFFQKDFPRLAVIGSDPVEHGEFEFVTGWRLAAPELRLSAGRDELQAEPVFGAVRFTGRHRLPVVDAGAGGPDDFGKARGALALVAGDGELSPQEQAVNAEKAGARGVLVADPAQNTFPLNAWGAPIPVIRLTEPAANAVRDLIRTGKRLDVDGLGHSPYVYNLMLPTKRALPANPSHTVRRGELATVTNTFYGVTPLRPTWETTHGWRPGDINLNDLAGISDLTESITRREYLSGGDTRWQQAVKVPSPERDAAVMYSGNQFYRPGEKREQTWWKGPLTPSNSYGDDLAVSGREGDVLWVRMTDHQDAERTHWGQPYINSGPDEITSVKVYRESTLLYDGRFLGNEYEVPAAASTYRIEHTVDRPAAWWTTSRKTSTTWTFRSARPSRPGMEVLPLIDADWDLRLGRQNDAPEFIPQPFTLRVAHLAGAPARPITRVDAWVSYDDGKRWYRLGLRRNGDTSYRGALLHPPHWFGSGHVSLRVSAADGSGGRYEQTIERAYKISRWR